MANTNFWYELGKYLETAGVGTVAIDLFIGKVPPAPDNIVAITTNQYRGNRPSPDIPIIQVPRVQLLVRNKSFDVAAEKLDTIRTLLQGIVNVRLPHWRILGIAADQEGGPLGQDEQGRQEFAISFIIRMHRIADE